jgi:hypothetical protein
MDRLIQIMETASQRELNRTMGRFLRESYEAVLKEPLSPHLEQLVQRIESSCPEQSKPRR